MKKLQKSWKICGLVEAKVVNGLDKNVYAIPLYKGVSEARLYLVRLFDMLSMTKFSKAVMSYIHLCITPKANIPVVLNFRGV